MTSTYKNQELFIIVKDVTLDDLEKVMVNPNLLKSIWNNRTFWEFKAHATYNINKTQFNNIAKLHQLNPRETYAFLETEHGVLNKFSPKFVTKEEFTSRLILEDREHMIELLHVWIDYIDWDILMDYIVEHEDLQVLDIVKNNIRVPDIMLGQIFIYFLINHKQADVLIHLDETGDLSLNDVCNEFINTEEDLDLVREIVAKVPTYKWHIDDMINDLSNVTILKEIIDIFPKQAINLNHIIIDIEDIIQNTESDEDTKPYKESWEYLKKLQEERKKNKNEIKLKNYK
jgi:hypothetical protein